MHAYGSRAGVAGAEERREHTSPDCGSNASIRTQGGSVSSRPCSRLPIVPRGGHGRGPSIAASAAMCFARQDPAGLVRSSHAERYRMRWRGECASGAEMKMGGFPEYKARFDVNREGSHCFSWEDHAFGQGSPSAMYVRALPMTDSVQAAQSGELAICRIGIRKTPFACSLTESEFEWNKWRSHPDATPSPQRRADGRHGHRVDQRPAYQTELLAGLTEPIRSTWASLSRAHAVDVGDDQTKDQEPGVYEGVIEGFAGRDAPRCISELAARPSSIYLGCRCLWRAGGDPRSRGGSHD
ncbi:hypothetical protein BD414DRAFT_182501 [Trametes punicea]|nr:hypothetical protein BD414DRAFT_182501 [Trametes punicea]